MPLDDTFIQQRWLHSHEEDHAGLTVFRPANYTFPPSRGREALDLRSGGTLRGQVPSAVDRSRDRSGHWSLDHNLLSIIFPEGNREFEVVEAQPDKLTLKRKS